MNYLDNDEQNSPAKASTKSTENVLHVDRPDDVIDLDKHHSDGK